MRFEWLKRLGFDKVGITNYLCSLISMDTEVVCLSHQKIKRPLSCCVGSLTKSTELRSEYSTEFPRSKKKLNQTKVCSFWTWMFHLHLSTQQLSNLHTLTRTITPLVKKTGLLCSVQPYFAFLVFFRYVQCWEFWCL